MTQQNQKIRLDHHLTNLNPQYNRSNINHFIKLGLVSINNVTVKKSGTLIDQAKDKVILKPLKIKKQAKLKIKVIFENDNIIVINKPVGLLVHSKGTLNEEYTLFDWLKNKINFNKLTNRSGIVHRLDRDTSGIMICAKNQDYANWLSNQFAKRNIQKTYVAIVFGHMKEKEAIIDLPIKRNAKKPNSFKVDYGGKKAITSYKVIKTSKNYSMLELKPKTGRTHQLRVHLEYLKHPIVGDSLYSKKASSFDRMYLHAQKLGLYLKDDQYREFTSKLPHSFNRLLLNDKK